MLKINKNGSTSTETVRASEEKKFSQVLAGVNGFRVAIIASHSYSIPKGYHVKGIKIVSASNKMVKAYKELYKLLLADRKLSPAGIKKATEVIGKIEFKMVLPNQEEIVGKLDAEGTMAQWSEDWKQTKKDIKKLDRNILLHNFMVILGGDLTEVKGKGTMFTSYDRKY